MNDTQSTDKPKDTPNDGDMPLMAHFAELRSRLIKIVVAVVVVFLALVGFSRDIYDLVSNPLVALLPDNASMIATDVASNFLAPIRLTFFVALFLVVPFVLWQIWGFIAPGLYKHEKRVATPLLLAATVLFYVGVAFAYFAVLMPALKFFISFAPDNVIPMTDIDSYLGFVMKLFLVFGAMFEIPVITLLLVLMRIVTPQALADKRRYIIVGCFFIAALVTPPDGWSMIMLAVPMCLLFEAGLILARVLVKPSLDNKTA
ncbi:twin arginine-targeting protein translocase TatC [Moraxella caviae]|uniref:Sec-independent protein translocase protein TatC n=1 Tax=Moraxella caviae TaxID=34060 RepID=A0A1T0A9A5_9GAMM|nr:twin-arginine translocase subunit TatC [Moraxella caviae]OOR91881.1 twin arginine-targeting protein translocase TatC [Moraxella caviae]STZ09732.1 Sec-independent protein translocase protein TatC [Moraxella caviae]VEW11229.1 Sec-independent protein translocase protein TatC [Moraxella caviae]